MPVFLMLNIISMLLAIMFFTLMEVQFLGKIHIRLGPNRVGFIGVIQPLSDFFKLFTKRLWFPKKGEMIYYIISPIICLFSGVIIWNSYGYEYLVSNFKWSTLAFFCLSSLLVFYLLLSGWASGSSFSLLGSYRSAAQTISYEVCLIFIILSSFFFNSSISISENGEIILFFLHPILFIIWMFSCLAEANRTPFDLSEGESELVSGFNTEYLGGLLSIFFITEYGFMIFMSFMTVIFFLKASFFWVKQIIIISFFIFARGAFPRMRFDFLMMIMWKKALQIVIAGMILSMVLCKSKKVVSFQKEIPLSEQK